MRIFVALALVSMGMAWPSRGQEAAPVYVAFSFKATRAPNNFQGVTQAKVEQDISEALAVTCHNEIPYWTFAAKPTPTRYPYLDVWLVENEAGWTLRTKLLGPGNAPQGYWEEKLFKPEDYNRVSDRLKPALWQSYLVTTMQDLLLHNAPSVQAALIANAPIGTEAVLTDPPALSSPQLFTVLPLDWTHYGEQLLGASEFKIRCDSGAGYVNLYSIGIGRAAAFTPSHPKGFNGLVVRLTDWEDAVTGKTPVAIHQAELPSLRPLAIYLIKINSTDFLVAP